MTQGNLFGEPEPKPPVPRAVESWDGIPRLVATHYTQTGGRCAHCDRFIWKGRATHKVVAACCHEHMTDSRSAKNGPGKWICSECLDLLT